MSNQIQSIRGVGCKGGYPYFAWGVYEPQPRKKDGKLTYRLVKSGQWFRSDKTESLKFDGIPTAKNVRHGSPA